KLVSTLEKLGVETIDTKNSMFDPSMHEAIHAQETGEYPQDKILQVWQKGYLYKGKLLRPAKVVVAKRKEEQEVNDE
ncbi:MAG: nucleotide exchange factor GrpE, partial [Actinobacteria bacterium]|nr:nucleotide exchange factor GrpE [Actinomycetota bacterium]